MFLTLVLCWRETKPYVYKVLEDNNIEKKEVIIGIRNEGLVEILSGLDEGDIQSLPQDLKK